VIDSADTVAALDADSAREVSDQTSVRMGKRQSLLDSGAGAYPISVPVSDTIANVRDRLGHLEADSGSGETVGVAGRVMHARNTGKLCFATIQSGDGARLQVMVSEAAAGADNLRSWKEMVDLGDHVFVHGEVISSRRGELSVMAVDWKMAAKALRPLPNLHSELSEETRARQRYLDLILRPEARRTVQSRAAVLQSLRTDLASLSFIEVETPMLQTIHGGAAARPFVTRSNALDKDLYLRIAPELFLKRAVVGGLDRVFEINRNFRNEGIDATHSPEFASIEVYQTYSDYLGMADLTQSLVQAAARSIGGSTQVELRDGTTYEFGGSWDRISLYGSLSDALGELITPETDLARLTELLEDHDLHIEHPTHGRLVEELWELLVRPSLFAPTFVMDFPVDTSPLVGAHRSTPGVVEKWDLYVRGFELGTAYSELTDPVVQRARLVEQAGLGAGGDHEAMRLDEEFLIALEYGMPPTGGMGMGIDRLLMALTGLNVRETILFPIVK
jgi:lysyl-tRNA synthetase class 2